MSDAAGNLDGSQLLENGIHGTTYMQDHGETKTPGELELRPENTLLKCCIVIGDEEVQPDLSDRDGATLREPRLEDLQILIGQGLDIQRMDAERVANIGMLPRKGGNAIETGDIHSRDHETADPRCARCRHDCLPVDVEFASIQMDVGIDQHCRTPREPDTAQQPFQVGLRLAMNASIPSPASAVIMLHAMVSEAIW